MVTRLARRKRQDRSRFVHPAAVYLQALLALVELGQEGAVDPQGIQAETVQVAEGGVTGTEVIDADAYPQIMKLLWHGDGPHGIGHGYALGDDGAHLDDQVVLGELPAERLMLTVSGVGLGHA